MSESWVGGWDRVWWEGERAEKTAVGWWWEDWWGAGIFSGWAGEWTRYSGWRWWAGQTARQWAEKRAGGYIEGWGLGKTTANWVHVKEWAKEQDHGRAGEYSPAAGRVVQGGG